VRPNPLPNASWEAALSGDRAAFQAILAPHLRELIAAARREIRYLVALGDLQSHELTAEELVGEAFIRAWHDRRQRPPLLGVKAWLLALLFQVGEEIANRARSKKVPLVSLEAPVPPEPIYDDDESFWEWYQPDEMTRWEDIISGGLPTPEDIAATNATFAHVLDSRARKILLMHDAHGVPLPEVALALRLPESEVSHILAEARRRMRSALGGEGGGI
jgi:RNA polymerase sigma-70 factor (ECF subfamily)